MSGLDDLLSKIPMNQLAQRLGVDQPTAERATRRALPALVGGMHENAKDPARAASLTKALGKHRHHKQSGRVDVSKVETADGEAIVHNLFGDNKEQIVSKLSGSDDDGVTSGLMGKLLPMLAPIVMSHVADKFGGGSSQEDDSGGLSDMLGGLLGGGEQGGVGDLLGGLLGGGRR